MNRCDVMHLHGLYLGQLDAKEYKLYREAKNRGLADVQYQGASGLMGLAKVVVWPETAQGVASRA